MNNHEELIRLYELATSKEYQAIKEELVKYIIKASSGSLSAEKLQGMLLLLNIPNNWILDYENELKKRKKDM